MDLFNKTRQHKLLSISLLLIALSVGIVIGTIANTGVHAARTQALAPDATPLTIPNPVALGNEFTTLAKRLEPSVVNITADFMPKEDSARKRIQPPDSGDDGSGDSQGGQDDSGMDLFRRFFHGGPLGEDAPRAFRREQSGSGFIVDKNGYILTNDHVVDHVDRIRVRLHGEPTEYRARLIGFDRETDLAVIKIDVPHPLAPVQIGNSDAVQVGDWAVAIGSPFNLEASVTAGIISATGREIEPNKQFQKFIQTDAAINPGNSGGPLLNIRGEVVGVNTMIATQSGGYQGIGFALPIDMAVRVYNEIIKTGHVTRGSIGISWNPTVDKTSLLRALGERNGVMVGTVQKGGPADKAGVKADDIIVAMNGKPVKDGDDLVDRVAQTPIGTDARLTIDRDGAKKDFNVTIQDRAQVFKNDPRFAQDANPPAEEPAPAPPSESQAQPKFGIKIKPLTEAERQGMGVQSKSGVLVTSVDPDSFAEDIGVQENDVIVWINRQPVSTVDEIRKVQTQLKAGDAVAFRVLRSPEDFRRSRNPQWAPLFVSGTLPAP